MQGRRSEGRSRRAGIRDRPHERRRAIGARPDRGRLREIVAAAESQSHRGSTPQGHVVGYLGDGINDGPALKVADVGISVDTAVDIAKETADIILLEKNLLVLDEGL